VLAVLTTKDPSGSSEGDHDAPTNNRQPTVKVTLYTHTRSRDLSKRRGKENLLIHQAKRMRPETKAAILGKLGGVSNPRLVGLGPGKGYTGKEGGGDGKKEHISRCGF